MGVGYITLCQIGQVNGCMEHCGVECPLSITLGFQRAICKIWPEFLLRCQLKLAC